MSMKPITLRRALLVGLLIAAVVAIFSGAWRAVMSLLVLLAAWWQADRIQRALSSGSTPTRLLFAVALLIVFWWVFYANLVPATARVAADFPDLEPVKQIAPVLSLMDAQRRAYLAVAISLPLLLFVFGVGPLSQHGLAAAPPTVAALGGAAVERTTSAKTDESVPAAPATPPSGAEAERE